jgi:hypothetical protein
MPFLDRNILGEVSSRLLRFSTFHFSPITFHLAFLGVGALPFRTPFCVFRFSPASVYYQPIDF